MAMPITDSAVLILAIFERLVNVGFYVMSVMYHHLPSEQTA